MVNTAKEPKILNPEITPHLANQAAKNWTPTGQPTSGTKGRKAKEKGKRKEKQQTNNLEDDQFNATVYRRSAALEKLAASQSEKARNTRNNTYLNLLYKHTINYDEDMLRRHKQMRYLRNCIHQLMCRL